MTGYAIQSTAPALYLDKAGKAVNGFTVYVLLTEFDELHNLNVPSLAEKDVKPAVETLLAQRQALAKLGSSK
jgi:hypothetical protein